MFDYKKNDYFALIKAIPGGWSFTSYESDGKSYRAINGFSRDGLPKNFTVFFGDRERVFTCPKEKVIDVIINNNSNQLERMKLSDYLKKSGYCEGEYATSPIFKKIDEVKDAKEIVDIKTYRIETEGMAVGLKGERLREIAVLLGEFSDNTDLQKRAALEAAGKNPEEFRKLIEDPSSEMKYTIQKAIKMGTLKQKGKVLTWDKEILGSGENQWVEYFIANEDKYKVLKTIVKNLK